MNNSETESETLTAGAALLARMKAIGIDYIFANSGTDFPPIIEGLAEASVKNIELPIPITIPHETAAMGMAHGYYLATGKAQAVMAHTNVGLANCVIGAINAATEHIPVLLFSGRTPVMEKDKFGARTVPIGWGQEMRDQTALVREVSKWDYELRFPEQLTEILDRAYAIANSTPRGPVYISLPREVLCETCTSEGIRDPLSMQPSIASAGEELFKKAAEILLNAKNPVIFAQRGAGNEEGFRVLSALAEKWAIPVCQYWAVQLGIPTDHPMAADVNPAPLIEEADAILVIDALAPWSPDIHRPKKDCRIIHMGQDPLYSRVPVRNFRSDISLPTDVATGIASLKTAMENINVPTNIDISSRYTRVAETNRNSRKIVLERAARGNGSPMTKEWVSLCLSDAIKGRRATVLSELGCPLSPMSLNHHQAWYQEPHSGGLGWSFPAGLGMKLADPDRLVISTMGDGSYMFSNPVACHQIAEALQLPILVIIVNNAEWGAVRESVKGIYPDGYAAKANIMPLTSLSPTPDFVKVAEASRAWARCVSDGNLLPEVLREAISHIETQRTLALIEARVG